jgi:hypothetical protein
MTRPRLRAARLLAGGVSAFLVTALLGVPGPAAAAEPTELARDTFSRTTSSGLGTAEKGGDWIASKAYSVSGGAARIATTPGQIQPAWLRTDSTDIDFVTTASFDRPDSGHLTVGVRGRMNGGTSYDAAVLVGATGALQLQLHRSGAVMASAQLSGLDFSSGDRIRIQMQTIGTYNAQLRAKVWETGTPEPSSWQVSAIDSTSSAPAASPVAFWAMSDGTTSPASIPVSFDDVTMSTTGAPPPPPPNKAPRALFTLTQNGRTITVDASASSDADGSIRSYEWEFGDGSTASGRIASHTYAGEGSWGIKLTVMDDDGDFGRKLGGVSFWESALFGKTLVSVNTTFTGGPQKEQFFGSGAEVNYGPSPTLTRGIEAWVTKPGTDTVLNLSVQPPSGKALTVGRFRQVPGDITDTVPRLSLTYESSAMSFTGDLDIRELTADSSGKITSFDIVFGGSDAQWTSPIWGQFRANQSESSRYALAARAISFPTAPVGASRIYSTQWIRNTASSSVTIGQAAVSGGSSADYAVANDGCSGKVLAPAARCSLRVGFSPRAAGIRNATLTIPVDGSTQRMELNGWSPAGKSSITLTGADIRQPTGAVYASPSHWVATGRVQYSSAFAALPQNEDGKTARVSISHGQEDLKLGRHVINPDPMIRTGHRMHLGAGSYGCQAWEGSSYTVHSIRQADDGVPSMADISFTVYCLGGNGKATTGRVQYNLRSDVSAPSRATSLRVSGTGASRTVSWSRSSSSDLAYTVARLVPGSGTNGNGTSGYAVYSGTGTSAALPAMRKGQRYTLHVFSVDKTGNVSAPATLAVTG